MTQQLVNVGTTAGDGTGDRGQVPFTKTNQNLTELYTDAVFFGIDSGTAGAYVIATSAYSPIPAAWVTSGATLYAGMLVRITPLAANPGAATLNFANTGAKAIVNTVGAALTGAEIQPQPTLLEYNGTAWQILSVSTQALFNQFITLAPIAALFYPKTSTENTAGINPVNINYPPGNVLRYGTNTTPGTTDMASAFASAVKACCPLGPSNSTVAKVYIPAGLYYSSTTWNLTNTRANGTAILDGLLIEGEGMYATVIQFGSGSGHAMVETTGSQWLKMMQLQLAGAATNPATVGIYQAVQTGGINGQTQNQTFENILISVPDNASANGGVGSVGIWNFGSEECTYDRLYITADVPLLFSGENPPSNIPLTTPPASYVSANLATSHSLGVSTFTGECFIAALNQRNPAILTENVNAIVFENTYATNIGSGGSNNTMWEVYGALQGFVFNGEVESLGRFMEVSGIAIRGKANVTFGSIITTTIDHLKLDRGGQGQIDQCEFNFNDVTYNTRPMFSVVPSSAAEAVSCYIRNSIFRANCDKQYLTVQENLLWNPNTGNVVIEGFHNSGNPYRYTIDANRTQEVAIPQTPCLINGGITSAEVVRFILPTITADSQNSLGADIWIEGIATINGSGTGSMSTRYTLAHVSVALSQAGAIFTATDTIFASTAANANSAGNNITVMAISATGATTYVQCILTPTRTGANLEQVNFTGTARMRWTGNESRAPSLQTLS